MTKPKVLLAFSGGLDTSYCVKYLSDERGYELHYAIISNIIIHKTTNNNSNDHQPTKRITISTY